MESVIIYRHLGATKPMIGIYCFTNIKNGHKYIGQSKNILQRKRTHYTQAFNPKAHEHNSILHRAFRKYGKENFIFEIVEECSVDLLNERERYWIQFYNSIVPNGYNVAEGGYCAVATKMSNEQFLSLVEDLKNTTLSYSVLSKKYHVVPSFIARINQGGSRIIDTESYPLRPTSFNRNRLTETEVFEIIELLRNSNLSMSEIAAKYNMKEHCVSAINRGRTHKVADIKYPIRSSKFANKRYYT